MTDKEAAGQFRDFALATYGREGAREVFLRLQDRDGADVPMLLWCLWCGDANRSVTRDVMEQAVAFSRAWRVAAVDPLRAVRRDLKPGVEGVPATLSTEGRGYVAKAEQTLELLQMDHLAALADAPGSGGGDPLFALYADCAGLELDEAELRRLST